MKAMIFNSGLGSRMGKLTENKPKCMVELYNGETILERQLRIFSECEIRDIIVTVGPYKEQIIAIANKYSDLNVIFVENLDYETTNYIVSMDLAYDYLEDDMLILHGDLVFNKRLIDKIIHNEKKSIGLYHEEIELPKKDFKGRFINNRLKEVSVSIFDKDCYAFQPLYKLSKSDIFSWKEKVKEFVRGGIVKVYAENALNEILDYIEIFGMSYKDDYIQEIDDEEDYVRVANEIKYFDYREQQVELTDSFMEYNRCC